MDPFGDPFGDHTRELYRQKKNEERDKVIEFLNSREKGETLNVSNQILDNEQNVVVDLDNNYPDWWREWGNDCEDDSEYDSKDDSEDLVCIAKLLDDHYYAKSLAMEKAKSLETQSGVNKQAITSAISKFEMGAIDLREFNQMLTVFERQGQIGGGKRLRKRRHTHKRRVSRTVGRRRTRGKARHSRKRTRSAARIGKAHRSKARHSRRRTRSAARRNRRRTRSAAPRKRNRGKNTRKRK